MHTPSSRPRFILTAGIAALLGGGFAQTPAAHAADILKANNADALSQPTSWTTSVPTAADVAVWDATVTAANTVALGADLSFGGIRIANPGGPVTINAGNTLTLGASGIDMSAATQNLTLNPALVLAAPQSWTVGASRTLNVGGAVNLGGNTLTLAGGGSALLRGIITGTIAGPANALVVRDGTKALLSGANTYTGVTLVTGNGAMLSLGNATALGATGAGNETVVESGATLNIGGTYIGNEIVRISGTGADGRGALLAEGAAGPSSVGNAASNASFIQLSDNATINAGGSTPVSFNAAGVPTGSAGRLDIRLASYTAGAKNLDLNGKTLTKTGQGLLALVNADVSDGSIVINEGTLSIEGTSVVTGAADGSNGTITVNAGGRLAFFGGTANTLNVTRPITLAGGTIGDPLSSTTAQTIASPITLTTANPNFVSQAQAMTFSGKISGSGAAITEIAKRGANTVAFNNIANDFSAPVAIYQGTLRADYATALGAGGVPGSATPDPLTSADTPLGSASTVMLKGGTLAVRVNMANDNTQQVFAFGKSLTVDLAPGGMTFDRLSQTSQTDKHILVPSLTFQPASAANGFSIGQNQFTFTQLNAHRLLLPQVTMNNDTVLTAGDFTFNGNINSAGRHSLVHTGGNTIQFVAPGTHDFNAFFHLGTAGMRVGSGFGTPLTSDTVTVGTGTIYEGPNNAMTFRTPNNLAPGQIVEMLSNRIQQATVNFEQFATIPANLRVFGSGGVLGVGGAGAFGDIDLARLGDGTLRIGAGYSGSGNGTVVGVVTPGAGNVVRVGAGAAAGSTVTFTAKNAVSGTAALEVGSPLVNGGFQVSISNTNQVGTVVLAGQNNYSGGTTVNRGSTLRFQDSASLGSGPITVFGTLTAEGAASFAAADGQSNAFTPNLLGGSTLHFNNSGQTDTTDTNRWGDTAPVNLLNGTLQITSRNNNASVTNETVGAVNFAGGSFINLNRQNAVTGNVAQLSAASLDRVGRGTLELLRSGGGTGSGFGAGSVLRVTGPAPVVTNGIVSPFITINDNTRFLNFASYDSTLGFVNASYTNTVNAAAFPTGLTNGTEIVYVDFASGATTSTLGDNPIVHALKVGAGQGTAAPNNATTIASGAGNTITIRSGGLIIGGDNSTGNFSNSTTATTATIAPALTFNNGTSNIEAVVHVQSAKTGVLNGAITAAGLTKAGAGTLNLTANNGTTLTGDVAVNQGILQLFGTTATNGTHNPAGTGLIQLAGGQLNVRSANAAGTTFSTSNNGSFVLQNGLSVAEGIPIATLDVNRSGADTTSSGTFTFNPATAGSTGLQLLGSPGAQGQTLTVSGANYAVAFGANAANTFNGNVTINNAVNVTLGQNPAILGTNPVITKSGAGNLIVGPNGGTPSVATGTQVVLNAGTLELRSIFAVGTGLTTSLVLNTGTLNLRRDSAGTYGGSASQAYPVTINGNVTISTDRNGGTATNFAQGIGTFTINGNPTVTFNNGNGVFPDIIPAPGSNGVSMRLNGLPFLASNVSAGSQESSVRLASQVVGGGFVKTGTGHLHLLSTNSYDGGTFINQGIVRARGFGSLGTGPVILNPGATLDLNAAENLNPDQPLIVRGNSAFIPMLSVNTQIPHPLGANVNTTGAPVGVLGLSNGTGGSYDIPIDMSDYYGGRWSLGGVSAGAYDPVYTAPSLGAGAGNLYRLGGGGTSFAFGTDAFRGEQTNVLSGNNNVRLGFDSSNILPVNMTNFQFSIAGTNNYSGGSTVIHRGMVARLFSANNGTFSGLSNSAVDVFGTMSLSGAATLVTGTGQTNAVTLHPGSSLVFDNQNAAANNQGAFVAQNLPDRWNDATPIALNGALLNLIGANNTGSTEAVGDVTYSRGSRIRVGLTGTGTAALTMNQLLGAGPGNTLVLQGSAAATLGAGDRILVTNNAPASVNGMVTPSIISAADNAFVTYDATVGFRPATFDKTLNATYTAGSLLPTDKVDVGTAALTLADSATVYALRTSQNINNGGPFNQVTIRSGGLIGTGGTIQPNLVFNDGAQNVEARIYVNGTLTINGAITANGITKFGHNGTAGGVAGTLVINVPQTNYASGWTVNSGTLQINDLQGLGQSVPGNTVVLNATQTTQGLARQDYAQTQLNFNRDIGTPEVGVFTGGPITVVNEGTIRIGTVVNDRSLQIPAVTLDSTDTDSRVSFTLDVPFSRTRGIIPTLTLADDAIMRVFDAGSTTDTGRVVAGVVNSLVGAGKNLTKIGNRTLELSGDNSTTFTGGSITVSQGTLRALHNGALGNAATAVTIERNATLEIGTPNFTPTATVTQQAGSIERWNMENARPGTSYTLPAGVNLQLNTNLNTARTINLNGGSVEGFLWTDHPAPAVQRDIASGVTINLLADSFVGQNILQGQGYDAGRAPTVAQPFADAITGSFLRIDGNITGNFNLTKTGLDTVTIAGSGNTYKNTTVDMGVLRIGRDNALPAAGILTTRFAGALDLYGFNQTVTGLGTADTGTNPGGTGVGSSGRIVNSAVTDNTLTVNNTAAYTYNGTIEQNVALTKTGSGTLTLGGANTHRGATTIAAGTLALTGSLSGTVAIDVQANATLDLSNLLSGFTLGAAQTLKGRGTVTGDVTANGTVAPGSDGTGTLTITGLANLNAGSTLSLEINGPAAFDRLVASGVTLDGPVNLAISLGYTPANNTPFVVLNNTSSNPIGSGANGRFIWSGPEGMLTEGETFFVDGNEFTITYQGGVGGNDVVLMYIPEPGTGAAILSGAAALLGLRRRRRA